jgi:hypothetical protein
LVRRRPRAQAQKKLHLGDVLEFNRDAEALASFHDGATVPAQAHQMTGAKLGARGGRCLRCACVRPCARSGSSPRMPHDDETRDSRLGDVCEDAVHVKQDRRKLGRLLRLCTTLVAPGLRLLLQTPSRNRQGGHGAEDCCRAPGRHAGWRCCVLLTLLGRTDRPSEPAESKQTRRNRLSPDVSV